MASILVTGGSGFLGSHTCLALLERGFNVFVIDSFEYSSSKSLSAVRKYFENKFQESHCKLEIFNGISSRSDKY